ncbi:hypothetical protein, variant [Blastomyces gilchristii SLH14081]|uniref:Uncharacterized protein n=1 Tax=Blastomyces gilchristii (strain SLH14081) TaxID=559298 RepID=A0A179USG6_BLAGS|nr:hypothetical protein, variant [Blastomyces gilchristii SLH14081]XP_031579110.1 uncharacterized protein BDBG_05691 [Blastomyces gilchristii SLH14081]OAT10007.1 hypothetical protein BDBG_05691 [Blastomyces gilchristii SLH14081]OAT10008.1 hypothetical protein, variant [Blastomyces gilchristii SLH14081]
MNDNPAIHLPANLSPHARQMLVNAYDRVLEARALLLAASDIDEHTEAHIRLAHAQEREQQIRTQVLGGAGGAGGGGGGSGSVQGTGSRSRSRRSDDSDVVNAEEEAEEMETEERLDYRGNHTPTKNAQSQNLFGSADLPIHPPLVGHMRLKSYMRERRHAALSVLTDQELLLNHAVANYETIPETRRRFQHHYIGLSMPQNYVHAFALQEKILGPKKTSSTSQAAASKAKGKGKAGTSTDPTHTQFPLPAATMTTGSTYPLPIESRLPVVDILEVDGGWRNQGAGDEGYGSVALPGSVTASPSAAVAAVAAVGGSDGGRRGSRRARGRGGAGAAGNSGSGQGQGRRRSARHSAGAVG